MNDMIRMRSAVEEGDLQAAEQPLPLVYEELRNLAAQRLAQEQPGQTLQPTAPVHEEYVRNQLGLRPRLAVSLPGGRRLSRRLTGQIIHIPYSPRPRTSH